MDERLQFVGRRLAGESMAELCREFGISRKTGYKIFDRYQECGVHGLTDRSRRPYRYANQLPFQVENYILNVKREHTSWGARKIRERLTRRFSGIPIPAKSTIHAVLDRHGMVERRGRVRRRAQGTPLSLGQRPNELWCTDYKGEFLLGNGHYCHPRPSGPRNHMKTSSCRVPREFHSVPEHLECPDHSCRTGSLRFLRYCRTSLLVAQARPYASLTQAGAAYGDEVSLRPES